MRTLVADMNNLTESDLATIKELNSLDDHQLLGLLEVLANPNIAVSLLKNQSINVPSDTESSEICYKTYDLIREILLERGVIEETVQ
jgi:hypothetical protein